MPLLAPPVINLPTFEGPLDVLLHLIREQRMNIADIPIVEITDQYLAILSDAKDRKLTLAGEFFVMAATLLEIKTRMMLPRPPALDDEDEGEDPRADLAQRLLDYERFKSLVPMLQDWEQERAQCFMRAAQDVEELYEAPVLFGQASAQSLLKAFTRVLERAMESEPEITSVHRKKLSLHLAMRLMIARVTDAGPDGVEFIELFPIPIVLFDVVMTFLALLELLRQGRLDAEQIGSLSPISIKLASEERHQAFMQNIVFSSGEE